MPNVFIALRPDAEAAARIAHAAGVVAPDDLHITLAFLGPAEGVAPVARVVVAAVRAATRGHEPFEAALGPLGRFAGDPQDTVYASVPSPGVKALRRSLVAELAAAGVAVDATHDFVGHMTLGRVARGARWPGGDPRGHHWRAREVWICMGREMAPVSLGAFGRAGGWVA